MTLGSNTRVEIVLSSPEETRALGRRLAASLKPGVILGLVGELGAGKTELVRGLAQGLGITEQVSSPTFVLECVYDVPEPLTARGIEQLCHWDLYRLSDGQFEGEIFDASGDPSKLTVVEWPDRVSEVTELLDLRLLIEVEEQELSSEGEQEAMQEDTARRFVTVSYSLEGTFDVPPCRVFEL